MDSSFAGFTQVFLPSLPWGAVVLTPVVVGGRWGLEAAPLEVGDPWQVLALAAGWGVVLGLGQLVAVGALAAGVVPAVAAWRAGRRTGPGGVLQAGFHNLHRGIAGAGQLAMAWALAVAPLVGALALLAGSDGAQSPAGRVPVVLLALATGLWGAAAVMVLAGRLAIALPGAILGRDAGWRLLPAAWRRSRGLARTTLGLGGLLMGLWLALTFGAALLLPAPDFVDLSAAEVQRLWPALLASQARSQATAQVLGGLVSVLGLVALTVLWRATDEG